MIPIRTTRKTKRRSTIFILLFLEDIIIYILYMIPIRTTRKTKRRSTIFILLFLEDIIIYILYMIPIRTTRNYKFIVGLKPTFIYTF
jgi:hypothetical protein